MLTAVEAGGSSMTTETISVRFNLQRLRLELQARLGLPMTWEQIAQETGLSQNTLVNLSRNKTRRVDFDTLEKLVAFFRGKGMHVDCGDILVVESIDPTHPAVAATES